MRAMRKKRASLLPSVMFHHDNAPSHPAATTQTAVRQRKMRASLLPSVMFHHDNAPSHRAATTQTAVRQLGFELLSHPPYSPDLSPCDFFIFRVMKTYHRGTLFDDTHELSAAVQVAISNIQPSSFGRCFIQSWLERCRKCIPFNGEYFEKD